MFDDSTVKGKCCFYDCVVRTKVFTFAINADPCFKLLPCFLHSSIPTGVCASKFSFFCWTHVFLVNFITALQSISIIHFGSWSFVFDDSTVVGKSCCLGCIVCTKMYPLATNIDLCFELLSTLLNSSKPSDVVALQFFCLLAHCFQYFYHENRCATFVAPGVWWRMVSGEQKCLSDM